MVEVPSVQKHVDPREAFADFLRGFRAKRGEAPYAEKMGEIAVLGKKSVVIDFEDILAYNKPLAEATIEDPEPHLRALAEAIYDIMLTQNREYAEKVRFFKPRLTSLPDTVILRELRSQHLGKLIMVEGILTRSTAIKQKLQRAVFRCSPDKGGCTSKAVLTQTTGLFEKPFRCESCKKTGTFELVTEESEFIDIQRVTLQERPEELPPGQLPRSLDCSLEEDIVDIARPGDRVAVVGVLKPRQDIIARTGTRLSMFTPHMEVNYVDVAQKGMEEIEISPEEEERIKQLARNPLINDLITRSIAPSIYGHEGIKQAISLQLLGGVPKVLPDGVRIRGDINVLLLGDPGTAKSQLLQYVSHLSPRGLYTTGRGTTAAGLTSAVIRDKGTGDYYLEAGALVLSDGGVACVDEIDKMRDEDRGAMHEAMEQQTVSIAKAGIVTTLNARAAVLAAANPKFGRYVPQNTVADNVDLSITILSRFDLIFILQDVPDPARDEQMAEHILRLRQGIPVGEMAMPIEPDLLKKYVAYARRTLSPKLTSEAAQRLKEYFTEIRGKAQAPTSPVPITARQLEALVRLAEARARARLQQTVSGEDAEAAIKLMEACLSEVGVDRSTGMIDIDTIMIGKPRSQQERFVRMMHGLEDQMREVGGPVGEEDFITKMAKELDIDQDTVRKTMNQMRRDGLIYNPAPGKIAKA